nr:EOG090X0CGE [Eulimnadia texana]
MATEVKSAEDAQTLLRQWREENIRNSEEVLELWSDYIEKSWSKLGDEGWLVLEQVCIAAFDCHNMGVADFCLSKLSREFPGSLRVKKLKAMKFEVQERYEEALELLDFIVQKDDTNAVPRKRKIALLKSLGKHGEAVKELVDYLKIFMADQEAWQELCDLYISQQDWTKAAFCMEELLLHSPHNHLYLQRLAEIKYTQGGYENLEIARSYYSQAAKLNAGNVRALYGIVLTCAHMASSPKCPSQKKKECLKLAEWASNQLSSLTSAVRDKGENFENFAVENLMGALQISGDAKA